MRVLLDKVGAKMIQFKNVTKSYNNKNVVNDISFNVQAGECVGYIGANGAGKTTSLKLLTGIIKPTSGEVFLLGSNPIKKNKDILKRIGVIFGNRSSMWPELSISDSMNLLSKIYKISRKDFEIQKAYLIRSLDLEKIINKPIRELSLGQRMIGEFGISMIHSPDILILDEPTIGLDLVVKDRLSMFLKKLQKEKNTTMIISSHDLVEVDKICDRLLVINEGHLLFDDDKSVLKNRIQNSHELLISHSESHEVLDDSRFSIISSRKDFKHISLNSDVISLNQAIGILNESYKINQLDVKQPTLNDLIIPMLTKEIK